MCTVYICDEYSCGVMWLCVYMVICVPARRRFFAYSHALFLGSRHICLLLLFYCLISLCAPLCSCDCAWPRLRACTASVSMLDLHMSLESYVYAVYA